MWQAFRPRNIGLLLILNRRTWRSAADSTGARRSRAELQIGLAQARKEAATASHPDVDPRRSCGALQRSRDLASGGHGRSSHTYGYQRERRCHARKILRIRSRPTLLQRKRQERRLRIPMTTCVGRTRKPRRIQRHSLSRRQKVDKTITGSRFISA